MAINNFETNITLSKELDKVLSEKSNVGVFTGNVPGIKYFGSKNVIVPDIEFEGLENYNQGFGFPKTDIIPTLSSYALSMSRARSLQIDYIENINETNILNLARKILGEYVRKEVIPECDSYILSKLSTIAISHSNTINCDTDEPFEVLSKIIDKVRDAVGYDEELVAFIKSDIYVTLKKSDKLPKIIVAPIEQNNVILKFDDFKGINIVPVTSERMKTKYNFDRGFRPSSTAREIYMLVCPKKAVHLVNKTNVRIITSEENADADAYKFNYLINYDVFVDKSGLDGIWTWISPEIK